MSDVWDEGENEWYDEGVTHFGSDLTHFHFEAR